MRVVCKFLSDTRNSNGEEYTPRSLDLILAGIQRHLQKLRPLDPISIFEDVHFKRLKMFTIPYSKGYIIKAYSTDLMQHRTHTRVTGHHSPSA